jgi:signal peptidase I
VITVVRSHLTRLPGAFAGVPAVVATALVGALLGLLLTGTVGTVLVVTSGSMAPVFGPGDALLNRYVPARDVEVGQVITFRDHDRDLLVTHRVASVRDVGRQRQFVTRGDSNSGVESWSADRNERLGLVALRVPLAGYPLAWAVTEPVQAMIYLILAVILGRAAITRIWRSAPRWRTIP